MCLNIFIYHVLKNPQLTKKHKVDKTCMQKYIYIYRNKVQRVLMQFYKLLTTSKLHQQKRAKTEGRLRK